MTCDGTSRASHSVSPGVGNPVTISCLNRLSVPAAWRDIDREDSADFGADKGCPTQSETCGRSARQRAPRRVGCGPSLPSRRHLVASAPPRPSFGSTPSVRPSRRTVSRVGRCLANAHCSTIGMLPARSTLTRTCGSGWRWSAQPMLAVVDFSTQAIGSGLRRSRSRRAWAARCGASGAFRRFDRRFAPREHRLGVAIFKLVRDHP